MRARIVALVGVMLSVAATRSPDIPFTIHMIDNGASETAAVADVNKDGKLDIISGENWYESPPRRLGAGAVGETQVSRSELHQQLLRQLQRSSRGRRRGRLSRSRARHLVRQEDFLVEESGKNAVATSEAYERVAGGIPARRLRGSRRATWRAEPGNKR